MMNSICERTSTVKARPIKLLSVIYILFYIIFVNGIYGQNKPAYSVDSATMTAVVLKDMIPNSFFQGRSSVISGFSIDLVKAIAKKSNKKVNFLIVKDWEEAEEALLNGKADFCPAMAINERRTKMFIFSGPVETFFVSICIRTQNREIENINSLKGKQVGVIRASQASFLIKDLNDLQIKEYSSFQEAIFDLLSGNIDAFLAPQYVITHICEKAGLEKFIRILDPPIKESKRAFAFPNSKMDLSQKLKPVIEQYVLSDDYQDLYRHWFLPPAPYWTAKRVFIWLSIIFVTVIFVIAVFYYRSTLRINQKLKQTVEDKEKALIELEESLLQIQSINTELEESKEKAEENNRLKTAFLQNMSHEIRTPMNAIMGFAELIPMNLTDQIKLENYSAIINQRCNDLLEIIDEILEISKIETGQVTLHIENCELSQILNDIYEFFIAHRKKMNKEHIDFKVCSKCDSDILVIATDIVKLKQILINLLNNAFKFTEQGSIELGCIKGNDEYIEFYVKDTGVGIPVNKKQFIFERFSQLEYSQSKLKTGTGLGLSIVKGLVHLLKGSVWVESEPGKGSIFSFKIPLSRSGSKPNVSIDLRNKKNQGIKKGAILIVEDDPYNVEYLSEILLESGAQFQVARNGAEVLEMNLNKDLKIVLMDIRLPDKSGIELTKIIKKKRPDIIIIAQTAYAYDSDKEKFMEAGCDDYISKPINREELLNKIDKWLTF